MQVSILSFGISCNTGTSALPVTPLWVKQAKHFSHHWVVKWINWCLGCSLVAESLVLHVEGPRFNLQSRAEKTCYLLSHHQSVFTKLSWVDPMVWFSNSSFLYFYRCFAICPGFIWSCSFKACYCTGWYESSIGCKSEKHCHLRVYNFVWPSFVCFAFFPDLLH